MPPPQETETATIGLILSSFPAMHCAPHTTTRQADVHPARSKTTYGSSDERMPCRCSRHRRECVIARPENEVPMIGHDTIAPPPHWHYVLGPLQTMLVRPIVTRSLEPQHPVDVAVKHVKHKSNGSNSRASRHGHTLAHSQAAPVPCVSRKQGNRNRFSVSCNSLVPGG